jgi:cation:H+ antiporter
LVTVVGCNIAYVGLVLGLAAVARPIAARLGILRPGIVVLIAAALLVWFLARDSVISQLDGVWLLIAAVVVSALVLRRAGGQPLPAPAGTPRAGAGVGWAGGVLLLVGVVGVTGGAALVVRSLPGLYIRTGRDALVIILTLIVPLVTLRALAAGVVAARRGEGDAVLGGVVGAGIVNLLLGVGLVAVARPIGVPEPVLMNQLPALGLSTLFLVPALVNGLKVGRGEGAVLFAAYGGFVAWVWARTP